MRKIVHKRIRHDKDGIHLVGDINAAIVTGGPGEVQRVSSRSRNRITQRGGRSEVTSDYDQEGETVDGGKETEKEV